jgi:branched-chain amino acid transport system ATP-binding protein
MSAPIRAGDASGRSRVLLEVQSVSLRFDGVQALDAVTFAVAERSRCGLIGPNGAGKTTLFNCISRLVAAQTGRISLDGRDLGQLPPHAIAEAGIARTFQGVGLIPSMSVLDNVMAGGGSRSRYGFLRSALVLPDISRQERKVRAQAMEVLEKLDIPHLSALRPSELPFGTQKRVELARALMSRPRLLMLDEPANGLTAAEVDELRRLLLRLWDDGEMTLLIVEHHMGLVMSVCDDIVVLDAGRVLARGAPDQIRNDPEVVRAYLGRRDKAAS